MAKSFPPLKDSLFFSGFSICVHIGTISLRYSQEFSEYFYDIMSLFDGCPEPCKDSFPYDLYYLRFYSGSSSWQLILYDLADMRPT